MNPRNKDKNKTNRKLNVLGWECPKCGSVYAWYVQRCSICGPKFSTSNTSNDEYEIEYNGEGGG